MKDGSFSCEKARAHFITITKHKLEVMRNCFAVGLYGQGIAHDLSKYTPTEFRAGAFNFQGDRSPNAIEREVLGYSPAWLHHKGRNRHHYEYWIDIRNNTDGTLVGKPMPTRYVVEMFCDRVAACKVYEGVSYTDASALRYYKRTAHKMTIHPDSAAMLEGMLEYLAEHGEKETFRAIRENIVRARFTFGECARF